MPQFKESQTSTNRSLSGFLSKQVRIHSFTPEINNNTQVKNTSTIPKMAYGTLRNETVLCEMVLCETVLCETVTQVPMRLNFSRWRPNPEN